jgi:hypothetical protein
MQYMKLDVVGRQELLSVLEAMPHFLRSSFASLSTEQVTLQGPNGGFSPVEQVWHLADLEREGFGVRIDRLLREGNPRLEDFDGAAVAMARNYRALCLDAGLEEFSAAREENLRKLREMPDEAWARSGTQDGVGPVSLCDIPSMIRQHDAAHRDEILQWWEHVAGA